MKNILAEFPSFSEIFTVDRLLAAGIFLLTAIAGILCIKLIMLITKRFVTKNLSNQYRMLVEKVVFYGFVVILLAVLLGQLGVSLTALLGAAGIVGLAVGIASQKSLGNIISGFFLVSENYINIGDVVKVGEKTGIVHSIDLLSLKLRTFDNLLIRIPNESLISNDVVNITKFPIRRLDFSLSTAYYDDVSVVERLLREVAKQNPLCLDEPEPLFLLREFGASGIEMTFGVWADKNDFIEVKNSIFREIKARFEQEGITIPYPHITVYAEPKGFPYRAANTD